MIKKTAFDTAGSLGKCRVEDTVVIAGSPRSGTTWILELLRTLPGYKALNEPLMTEEARQGIGFSWRTYREPDEQNAEQQAHLKRILTGKLGISPAWHFESESRPEQLVEHATRDRLVVKFCRLNRMLHWFCRQFDVGGLALIVRHPCAVVSSMLRHGAWDERDLDGPNQKGHPLFIESLPDELRQKFGPLVDGVDTLTEALAVMWGLDQYIPLVYQETDSYPWILVPYERMVRQGQRELRRITDALGVEVTAGMKGQLREPSSSVKDQLHQEAGQQLSKWRRHLSSRQADDVLRIVDEVGLSDLYDRTLEPDYNQLNRMQRPAAQW